MLTDLVLFRHAKAVRPHEAPDDFLRGLTPRGQVQARAQAESLYAAGCTPDLALVSTAARAMQTWQQASPIFQTTRLVAMPELYLASPDIYLDAAIATNAERVMVIAHDPGLHELARWLMKGAKTNGPGGDLLRRDLPTAGVAWFVAEATARHGFALKTFLSPAPV
jgi:phosphohistidine phosphatase